MEECDPAEIIGTVLVDAAGRHAVRIVSVIGTGSFAHVYLAETVSLSDESLASTSTANSNQPIQGGEKRAVKRLFKAGLDERQLLLQRQEAEVMKLMAPHPNIIQLLATVEDAECLYLIMEYCELDLYEAITQQGGFPEDVVKEVFVQVADAVLHCHNSGFYHRDLKPENCLISTANYKVKLADFGLTTTDEWSTELGCGSVRYMAPECFELTHNTPEGLQPGQPVPPPAKSLPVAPGVLNGGYSPAANDVWALGVILLNLLFGKNPWFEAHMTDAIFSAFAISNHNILRQQFNLTLQFDAILRRVFELDPRRRCSVTDLKILVEGCTQFVETDPTAISSSTVPTPSIQQSRLKRHGNNSSILAGPGYIVKPGDSLPAVFTQPAASITSGPPVMTHDATPITAVRKGLRTTPTFASLKAVAANGESISEAAAARVPGDVELSPMSAELDTMEVESSGVSTASTAAVTATAADDGEGVFPVVDVEAHELEVMVDEEHVGVGSLEVSATALDDSIDVAVVPPDEVDLIDDGEEVVESEPEDIEEDHVVENVEEMRKLMQEDHVEKMMMLERAGAVEDEEDDESVVVRPVGEGSLLATVSSLARTTVTAYTGTVEELEQTIEEAVLAVEDSVIVTDDNSVTPVAAIAPAELPLSDSSVPVEVLPSVITPPALAEETTSEAPVPTSPTTVQPIIQPPPMERHESNPYIPPPRTSLVIDPSTTTAPPLSPQQPSRDRRSSSPLKWFAPFISRDSARVDQPSTTSTTPGSPAQRGKVGLFGMRKRGSKLHLMRNGEEQQWDDGASAGGRSTASANSTPFGGLLRKRRSTIRNVSGGTVSTAVNSLDESADVLPIEEAVGSETSGKKLGQKRSTLSMKEFSSGLKGALGLGKRRSGVLERNQ